VVRAFRRFVFHMNKTFSFVSRHSLVIKTQVASLTQKLHFQKIRRVDYNDSVIRAVLKSCVLQTVFPLGKFTEEMLVLVSINILRLS